MATLISRTHPKDLASAEEIQQMMAKGAQRVPSSHKHFPDFSTVEEWMKEMDIKSGLFRQTKTINEVAELASEVKPMVVERTLKQKPIRVLGLVEEYLGEEDNLTKTDIAIVFGGKTLSRAEKGAEMYLGGWTKKLLMTGKGPNYKGVFDKPEAEVFKDRAVELGVPEIRVIVESGSINIPDNVKVTGIR